MFGRRFGWGFSLVGFLLVVLAAAGIGYLAYNAGVSAGVAQAADLPEAELPPAAYGPYYGLRPFGIGFGLFGCLVPLLILFLLFGGLRMLFAPWRMGPWGRWGRGWGWRHKDPERWERFREQAERWHEEMHGQRSQPEESDQV